MAEAVFDPKADSPLSDEELARLQERYAQFDVQAEIPPLIQEVFDVLPRSIELLEKTANAFDHLVYAVSVEQEGTVLPLVVRINASSKAEEMLCTEAAAYALLALHGILAPHIYATGLRTGTRAFDFMVMQRIGTGSLEALLTRDTAEEAAWARRAGAYLARVHGIALPGFGMLAGTETLQGAHASWREAFTIRLDETVQYLVQHSLLTHEEATRIKSMFDIHEALERSASVLLHGDFHPANIIINEVAGSIAGAVDLSQAKVGDPLFDLAFYATYVSPEIFAAFLEGYGKELTEADQRALALYSLRIYLSKAKLRKRFGYEARIPVAQQGIRRALAELE